jgi:hypothetical protein
MPVSEEDRQRRRELALRLNSEVVDPETGRRKFGGPQPGAGRPRKKRAAEIVADEARKEANKIIAALKDSLDPMNPASVRLQGAKQWLDIENKEAALQLQEDREDRELQKMDQDELLERVGEAFVRLASAGALDNVLTNQLGIGEDEPLEVEYEELRSGR